MQEEQHYLTELNPAGSVAMARIEPLEMTVEEIAAKVARVRHVASAVMRDGVHYGTITGTPKPTLYKAGGEILCLACNLAPRYQKTITDLGNGHREYDFVCDLFHKVTGAFMAQGVGSCSTMETKYRFRPGPVVPTGRPVPKEYWDNRESDFRKAQQLLGGKGFAAKKIEGKWEIVQAGEVIENPNIADTYNTALKIGAKRAYLDAVLKATAASEVYTQDLKDEDDADDAETLEAKTRPIQQPQRMATPAGDQAQPQAPPKQEQRENFIPPPAAGIISEPQRGRLMSIAKKTGFTEAAVHKVLNICGYEHSANVLKRHYQTICEWFEATPAEQSDTMAVHLANWIKEH